MSILLYDKAVTEKIKSYVMDTSAIVLGPDEVQRQFEIQADLNDEKPIQLPFITISRERDIAIKERANWAQAYAGKVYNNEDGESDHLNAIPITLNYVLNIYTKYGYQADAYIREFVFMIVTDPEIEIDIPFNGSKIKHTSNLYLGDTITDNSDIEIRLSRGQPICHWTLRFQINDAELHSYDHRAVPQIVGVEKKVSIPSRRNKVVRDGITIVEPPESKRKRGR